MTLPRSKRSSTLGGDLLDDLAPDDGVPGMSRRLPELIGGVLFSVQAGKYVYSTPRAVGRPLSAYSAVEVAMVREETYSWLKPRHLAGFEPGFDEYFEGDAVAGYVPLDRAKALRDALIRWAAAGGRFADGPQNREEAHVDQK